MSDLVVEARRVHALLPTDRPPTVAELAAAMAPTAPAPEGPETVWVFGSFRAPGVRLLGPYGAPPSRPITDTWPLLAACDHPPRGGDQPEGHLSGRDPKAAPFPPGFSFVAWWDRQGDKRGGITTGILARGTWTDAELVAAGRRLAPWAFRVEVRL